MERLLLSAHRRARLRLVNERGFSLVELVIASGVMALVLSSLAYLGTVAFADASLSKSRQTATALVNQAIEQVRALPYDTVALGLRSSDLASGADATITAAGGTYSYGGERIPHGLNATVAPLVPHQTTVTVADDDYLVSVYVTYLDDDATTGAFRVTARAAWVSGLREGTQKFVEAQTVIAPCTSDDGSGAIHPFCAPNQPFLYANSELSEGGVTISVYDAASFLADELDRAALWLPLESTNMQIEQIQAVAATARTSGVTLSEAGQPEQVAGRQQVAVGADSSPAQQKPIYETASVGTGATAQSATTLSMNGSAVSLSVTSSAGDQASATATVLANGTNTCANAASTPVNQLDALPCGSANASQVGTMSAAMSFGSLGSATLASIASPSLAGRAHTNRDANPQPASCPSTSGDGCIHASHRHVAGTVSIGGVPASLAPLGFTSLLRITNSVRTVSAEAGIGNANPTATSTGTVQYWSGLGPTTVNLNSSASVTIPINVVLPSSLSTTRVELSGTLRTGAVTAPACPSPCTEAIAQAESPVVGSLRYRMIVGGVTVADLLIHIDLGTLLAQAEYTPSA